MLNRRFLRKKALQNLYAYYQTDRENLEVAEKNMLFGIHKLYELYVRLASLIVEINNFANQRIIENKQKYFPTEEEKNPNMRFADNRFIVQIKESPMFVLKTNEYKISWNGEEELIRHLYNIIVKSKSYQEYMDDPDSSYEKDKVFVCSMFKRKIANNSNLYHFFEDANIYWADDFDGVCFWLLKNLKSIEDNTTEVLPDENRFADPEDIRFVKDLFRKTAFKADETRDVIETYLENWELERTPLIDILILTMAITELTEFPSIPVKVTMNEYIEIAKEFSTEKSRIFINGILNKLVEDYTKSGKIKKSGRGLI